MVNDVHIRQPNITLFKSLRGSGICHIRHPKHKSNITWFWVGNFTAMLRFVLWIGGFRFEPLALAGGTFLFQWCYGGLRKHEMKLDKMMEPWHRRCASFLGFWLFVLVVWCRKRWASHWFTWFLFHLPGKPIYFCKRPPMLGIAFRRSRSERFHNNGPASLQLVVWIGGLGGLNQIGETRVLLQEDVVFRTPRSTSMSVGSASFLLVRTSSWM